MAALLTAAFLLLARIFKLGFLADFLSRTVLVGFLTGVGCQVAIAMLSDMLGIRASSHHTLGQAWEIIQGLTQPSSSDLDAVRGSGGKHSGLQSHCPAITHFIVLGRWDDRRERCVWLC